VNITVSGVVTFRPQQMREMQTVVIDVSGVCEFLSLSVTQLYVTAVQTWLNGSRYILFWVENLGDLNNIVLNGGPYFSHGFDAAFAKVLWPLVPWLSVRSIQASQIMLTPVQL